MLHRQTATDIEASERDLSTTVTFGENTGPVGWKWL